MVTTPFLIGALATSFFLYLTKPALAVLVLAGVVALILFRQGRLLVAAAILLTCLVALAPALGGALVVLACATAGFALIFGWGTR